MDISPKNLSFDAGVSFLQTTHFAKTARPKRCAVYQYTQKPIIPFLRPQVQDFRRAAGLKITKRVEGNVKMGGFF
jgi:hypothetical protein